MCGIVGVLGSHEAAPILVDALKRLEYRGYDSAGLQPRITVHSAAAARWENWPNFPMYWCMIHWLKSGHWAYPLGHPW